MRSRGLGNGVLGPRKDKKSERGIERGLLPAGWEGGVVEWKWDGEGGLIERNGGFGRGGP